jgi:hypothetical protein
MINHILNGEPRREHGNACGGVGGGGAQHLPRAHKEEEKDTKHSKYEN